MKPTESLSSSSNAYPTRLAEREFLAFITAVTDKFGPDQARLSAEDWLEELELMDSRCRFAARSWRLITIATSNRLAKRLAVANSAHQ